MSKDKKESLAEIAYQLQEQLRFYRELGITDLGGPGSGTEVAPVADFKASPMTSKGMDLPAASDSARAIVFAGEAKAEEPESAALPVSKKPLQAFEPVKSLPLKQPQAEIVTPEKTEAPPQAGLFGAPITEPLQPSSRNALPILSSFPEDISLEAIRADLGDCRRCKLHEQRTRIVFGEGNPHAKLMFVGEGPGADEDLTGRPFVGRAGQLLDKIIAAIGYKREDVYIANVVKCFISPRVLIYTLDGYKPIKDIRVGDLVLTHTGHFRTVTYIRPKENLPIGSEIVKLVIAPPNGGRKLHLTVTPEHPFLINGEWKSAGDIKEGERIKTLGDRCEVCGKIYFVRYDRYESRTYRTCGPACHNKRVMYSPETREKIRHTMRRQYAEGLRDPIAITVRANERTRELVAAGEAKIQRLSVSERYRGRITLAANITAGKGKHPVGYGEEELKQILQELGIEYIHHFALTGSAFTYDFCLPSEKIFIEVRGPGFTNKAVQERALIKDQQAEDAGYTVLCLWWLEIVRHPNMIKLLLKRLLKNHRDDYVFTDAVIIQVKSYRTKSVFPLYNIGVEEDESYIAAGIVSHNCRPPQNRTPEREEVDTCEQFLFRQIALIKPKVIVALGSPAFQCLFRTREGISKARGELREWNDIKVMPTFHPAYLLRSPDKKREAWEDMKIVRDYLNSIAG